MATTRVAGLTTADVSFGQNLNNAGFMVERSLDARSFAAIGTVAGAGTSTARRDYVPCLMPSYP